MSLKRVRIHEVRLGMFVEELEVGSIEQVAPKGGFFVETASDLDRLAASHVISVVINLKKGAAKRLTDSQPGRLDIDFDTHLTRFFTSNEIALARKTISETRAHVREIIVQAHQHRVFELDAACVAVEKVMSQAMLNAGALIGVARLKEKDEGTFLHSFAVSALMITFGRKLCMDEKDIRMLGLGGLVHDLGKMTLPIDLLRKLGKLTPQELALIRTHPQRGYEMVCQYPGVAQAVLDICLFHHEKFDGSGYPKGLVGTSIPFMARIAAICDVYDALTTVRPYKRAWSKTEALNTMTQSVGHFDPELLSAFISKMVGSGVLQ